MQCRPPFNPGALKGTRNGNLTRSPPIIGMLLGPANLRVIANGMCSCVAEATTRHILIDDQGTRPASSNIIFLGRR